ncbi:MAG: hypothetical protein PHQ28_16170 [Mycobacterium sp.]|nr:hypothetical protein [Mycobacterium sp.]
MIEKTPQDGGMAGTDQPSTTAGPCDDETALVAPPAPEPELAWALEDDYTTGASWGAVAQRASVILIGAAIAAVVVGLVIWLGLRVFDRSQPNESRPTGPSAVMTSPAAALSPSQPTDVPRPVAPVAPPSTVTVTPAPPATVTVEAAPPPDTAAGRTDVFVICPDGHEGVVGGHTSCAFAENVRRTFYATGMSNSFTAFSPVTGEGYEITCVGRYPAYFKDGSTKISTRCYGGNDAEVVIW